MGKRGYNWKARHALVVEIDNTSTEKIAIEIEHRLDNYDSCNALVLPNEKRTTKNKETQSRVTRLLSRKRRKQLEKVVERKQKKLRRAALLEELAKVQAPLDELKRYISLTSLQTQGLKRRFREPEVPGEHPDVEPYNGDPNNAVEPFLNSVRGAKRKRLALLSSGRETNNSSNPNIVGFEETSESESSGNERVEEEFLNKASNDAIEETSITNKVSEEDSPAYSSHERGIEKLDTSNNNKEEVNTDRADKNYLPSTVDNVRNSKAEKNRRSISETRTLAKSKDDNARSSAVFVGLDRRPEIQAARLKLPVVAEEQAIVEAINDNPVVIITGETGSGKTTQVPQFLYEAGYARHKLIGVTEPRRVAAMSMSKRVAEEMNLSNKKVSYLIRFEGNVTTETKIKFMTDGVLLKEIQSDFLLTKYSVIILDEAHERSVYTDILIGLLSRIVPLRNKRKDPLKLVIMSATLRVEEFAENKKLFRASPPVISVESRQFPVTVHFNRRTSTDYVTDALRKTVKIHTRLPDGGILVFLTGQQEVNSVVRKLRKAFPIKKKVGIALSRGEEGMDNTVILENESSADDYEKDSVHRRKRGRRKQLELPAINLDNYAVLPTDDPHEDLLEGEGEGEGDDDDDDDDVRSDEDDSAGKNVLNANDLSNAPPLWVLPLYSLLPSDKQARVFDPPPDGCRLCVVATNVAETSLTIPNIKYVIDCGRCKTRMYDKVTGVSTYRVCFTSKAAANQRAGRAGRTGPGHCYRLYSSAVFNDQFEEHGQSEIQRKPIDDLLLRMKVMNIDKVVNFPFPTPPDAVQLKTAERRLCILGALQQPVLHEKDSYNATVTPLGHSIAAFPVAPRYGKMLALSHQHDLLPYTICMVAALSVQQLLVEAVAGTADGTAKNKWLRTRRCWAGRGNSLLLGDLMVLIRATGAAEYAGFKGHVASFCEENGLRHKAVVEIRKLRQQLTNEINLSVPDINLSIDPMLPPPTDVQAKLLRQIVLAGTVDQVARRVDPDEIEDDRDRAEWRHAYKTLEMEEPVFMHSSCVLRKTKPDWVVYQEAYESGKMYMRGVTAIEPEWLVKFAPALCRLSDPLADPPPRYDAATGKLMCRVTGTFGKAAWELPAIEIEHPLDVDGVKRFARFLLEGEVCPKLKRFVPFLLSTPSSVDKPWAKLIPRVEATTKALMSEGVVSKDKLLRVWSANKTFLLSAYRKWLPESAHAEVELLWPPV